QTGRYGAWARFWEPGSGERDGKKYSEVHHYATLVFDVPFAKLPQPSAALGAVAADGWLYVYGGHRAPTHSYLTDAVSGRLDRLRLTGDPVWEELPGGAPLQGMNLATHDGKIYLVGGMAPRNKKGERSDNYSVAEVSRFDPKTRRWDSLPPLPEARSS